MTRMRQGEESPQFGCPLELLALGRTRLWYCEKPRLAPMAGASAVCALTREARFRLAIVYCCATAGNTLWWDWGVRQPRCAHAPRSIIRFLRLGIPR